MRKIDMEVISFINKNKFDFNGVNYISEIKNKCIEEIYCIEEKISLFKFISNDLEFNKEIKNDKKCIILLEDINKDNIKIINTFTNSIILTEKIEEGLVVHNKVMICNSLVSNELINVKALLVSLSNVKKYILISNKESNIVLLYGYKNVEEPLGSMVYDILMQINHIYYSSKIIIDLQSSRDFSLNELTFVEDPIKEYIKADIAIEINKKIDEKLKEKFYYSLIAVI